MEKVFENTCFLYPSVNTELVGVEPGLMVTADRAAGQCHLVRVHSASAGVMHRANVRGDIGGVRYHAVRVNLCLDAIVKTS